MDPCRIFCVCQLLGFFDGAPAVNSLAAGTRVSSGLRFLYFLMPRDTPRTSLSVRHAASSLARNGRIMQQIGEWCCGGLHPHHFNGLSSRSVHCGCRSYVAVANQDSNNVFFFRRDECIDPIINRFIYGASKNWNLSAKKTSRCRLDYHFFLFVWFWNQGLLSQCWLFFSFVAFSAFPTILLLLSIAPN